MRRVSSPIQIGRQRLSYAPMLSSPISDEKQFHDLLAKFSCKGVGHQMTLIFADQKKREGEGGALTRWSIGPQTIQTALWPSFQPQNCPKPFSISTKTCVFTQKVITICRIDSIHYSFRRSVIWQGHKVKQQALSINNLEFGGKYQNLYWASTSTLFPAHFLG